jgi:hypothetical protein
MLSYIMHLVNEKGDPIGEYEYNQQVRVRTVAKMARQGNGAGMMLLAQMMGAAVRLCRDVKGLGLATATWRATSCRLSW